MSDSDDDDFFISRAVAPRPLSSSPATVAPKPARKAARRASPEACLSSSPSSSPQPLTILSKSTSRRTVPHESHAAEIHIPRNTTAAGSLIEELFEKEEAALNESKSRPRSPRNATSAARKQFRPKRRVEEDLDDIAFSDFDEGYMNHDRRKKQKAAAALEVLRAKRQSKPAEKHAVSAVEKQGICPVCDRQYPLSELEAHTSAELERQTRGAQKPTKATRQLLLPLESIQSAAANGRKTAGARSKEASMNDVAARVAAQISAKLSPLEALPGPGKQAAQSRSWAFGPREVNMPSKSAPIAASERAPTPVQPEAGPSKVKAIKVIDLDDDSDDDAGEERAEHAVDAAFGMDRLSPKSRRAFLAVAGLADEEDSEHRNGSKLNDDWNMMNQEKATAKTAKQGKTWASRGWGRGKAWLRRGWRGRGKGRGRGR